MKRKRSWSKAGESSQTVVKPGLTARKVLLWVWWGWKGIIHYELPPYGQTLNFTIYCEQLDHLKQAIDQKCPELANRKGVVFHQDNARPHTSLVTRQKLRELGWEILSHPPYSPDIAPSDYLLFLSMAKLLVVLSWPQKRLVKSGCLTSSQIRRGFLQGGYYEVAV